MIKKPLYNVRQALITDDEIYCFCVGDYAQVEFRVAAHISKDPNMVAMINKGVDVHCFLAERIYGKKVTKEDIERQYAKTANFLLIFGGSAWKLQNQILQDVGEERPLEECEEIRETFFSIFDEYEDNYLKKQRIFLRKYRCSITPFGLIRHLPEIKYEQGLDYKHRKYKGKYMKELEPIAEKKGMSVYDVARKKVRHAYNQAYNTPIQGAASSIAKRSMLKLHKLGFDLVTQEHDKIVTQELKSQAKEREVQVKDVCEHVVKMKVPLVFETKLLNSWSEADAVEFGG